MNSMHNSFAGPGGYSGAYSGYVPPPSALPPYYNGYPSELTQAAGTYYGKPGGGAVPPVYGSGVTSYSASPINNSSMYYQQYGLGYQYGYSKYGLGYSSDLPGGGGIPPPSIGGLQPPTSDLGLTGSMFSKGSKYNSGQGSPSPLTSGIGLPHGGSSMLSPAASTSPSPGPHAALQNSLRGPGATPSPPVDSLESKKDLDRMKRCQVCGQVFRLMSECLAHMKSVHSPLSVYSLQASGCHATPPMSSASTGLNPHSIPVSLCAPSNPRSTGMSAASDTPLMALERMGWGDKQGLIPSLHNSPSPITTSHSLANTIQTSQSHSLVNQHSMSPHSTNIHNSQTVSEAHHFGEQMQAGSPLTNTASPLNRRNDSNPNMISQEDMSSVMPSTGREIASPIDQKVIGSNNVRPKKTNSYYMSSIIGETNESRPIAESSNNMSDVAPMSNHSSQESNISDIPPKNFEQEEKNVEELKEKLLESQQQPICAEPDGQTSLDQENRVSQSPEMPSNQTNVIPEENTSKQSAEVENKSANQEEESNKLSGQSPKTTNEESNSVGRDNSDKETGDDQPDLLCHEEGALEDESNESMDESKSESKPSPKTGLEYLREKLQVTAQTLISKPSTEAQNLSGSQSPVMNSPNPPSQPPTAHRVQHHTNLNNLPSQLHHLPPAQSTTNPSVTGPHQPPQSLPSAVTIPHQQPGQHSSEFQNNSTQPTYGNWPSNMNSGYPNNQYPYSYSHPAGSNQPGGPPHPQGPPANKPHGYSPIHQRFASPYQTQASVSGPAFPPNHDSSNRVGGNHSPYPQNHWFPPASQRGENKGNWSSWPGHGNQASFPQNYYPGNYQGNSPHVKQTNQLPPPPQAHSQSSHHVHQSAMHPHLHRDMQHLMQSAPQQNLSVGQQQLSPAAMQTPSSIPMQQSPQGNTLQHRQSPINMQKNMKNSQSMMQQQQQQIMQQQRQVSSPSVACLPPSQQQEHSQKMQMPSPSLLPQHSPQPNLQSHPNVQSLSQNPNQQVLATHSPSASSQMAYSGSPLLSMQHNPRPSSGPTMQQQLPLNLHHPPSTPIHHPPSTSTPIHHPPSTSTPIHHPSSTSTPIHHPSSTPIHHPSSTPIHHPPSTSTPIHHPPSTSIPIHHPPSTPVPHSPTTPANHPPLMNQNNNTKQQTLQHSQEHHLENQSPNVPSTSNKSAMVSKSLTTPPPVASIYKNNASGEIKNISEQAEAEPSTKISEANVKKTKANSKTKPSTAKQYNQLEDFESYKCTITVHENGTANDNASNNSIDTKKSVNCNGIQSNDSSDNEYNEDRPKLTTLHTVKRRRKSVGRDGTFLGPKRVKIARQALERKVQRQKTMQEQIRQNELEELIASQRALLEEHESPFGDMLLKSSILLGDDKLEISETVEECIASIKGDQLSLNCNSDRALANNSFGKSNSVPEQNESKKPTKKSQSSKVLHNENSVNIVDAEPVKPLRKLRAKDFKWSHYMKAMRFWCNDCAQGFRNQRETALHTEERCKWNCLYMMECYVSVKDVQSHALYGPKVQELLEEYQIDGNHSCTKCDEMFSRKADYLVHIDTHKDVMPFECTICCQRFKLRGALKEHLRQAHMKGRLPCLKCNKVFPTSTLLRQHVKVHTQNYKYKSGKNREDEIQMAMEATASAVDLKPDMPDGAHEEMDKFGNEASEYRSWCKLLELNAFKSKSSGASKEDDEVMPTCVDDTDGQIENEDRQSDANISNIEDSNLNNGKNETSLTVATEEEKLATSYEKSNKKVNNCEDKKAAKKKSNSAKFENPSKKSS